MIDKSAWILFYNAGDCGGCRMETETAFLPQYIKEHVGLKEVFTPSHADILIVTGAVNEKSAEVINNIYSHIPEPKAVIALGVCASSGGIFIKENKEISSVSDIIPVDVMIDGCPPTPDQIIDGIERARERLLECKEASELNEKSNA